jgi:uncharacterized protein DUF2786
MNQAPVSESIVRKIQLLLNLASRVEGNEAEAAAAMGKAQELLAQHNLDLSTVQDAVVAGGTNQTKEEVKRERVEAKRNATYEWTRRLVKAVAEANYCVYFCRDVRTESKSGRAKWAKRHAVLGRADNTAVVLVMTDYLYATIMRLLPYDKSTWLTAEALAWCDGCVDRLIVRIEAKAAAMRAPDYAAQGEHGYTTAIMVRSMAESERIANYDAVNGKDAWANKVARDAEYERTRPEREARWALEARQRQEAEAAKLLAETPEQKAKRLKAEEKEARASERYWAREDRKTERAEAKLNSHAYRSGKAVAETIGLDSQLKHGAKTPSLA